ncbi:zinc ribbon domain-containing protein [Burkholderia sp. Ax-1719]|uniref:zinc ribbon domain-containing protein n=1 Tax=Burkholderia sp. Ax-1719 TaxID=2608334 RepID=UPI001421CAEF|nr:zinc ribbon domain-containing protein [Burkholderia sp. Ax-1719]NIE67184.1 zinc ribbon domain-containing protein [Burkholderia sp. Ax-1719]
MSAQTIRDQHLPAACKHCGAMLKEYVDSCPYCGAKRPLELAALRVRSRNPSLASGAPSVPANMTVRDHPQIKPEFQPHTTIEHESAPGQVKTRSFPKVMLLVLLFLALVYAAYLMLGGNRKSDGASDDQGSHSLVGSILPYLPHPLAKSSDSASTSTPAPQADTPKPVPAPQYKDVPDSLRAAHASLAANNLSDAKAADSAALARDAGNNDAQAIQRDIATREQQRDSALQNADRCANQHDWACVQQQASQALAIDSSSQQAQSLMERAILSTAWAPQASATAAAPAAPAASGAASNDNAVDARQRAILQNGWKQATPSGSGH